MRLTSRLWSAETFKNRREKLKAVLEGKKLDAYFFSGVSDLYYLTGFHAEGFYGLFTRKGQWLFSSALMADQVRQNTQGCRIIAGKRLSASLREIRLRDALKRIGFDPEQLNYRLGSVLVKEGLRAAENPLIEIRAVKEKEELDCLRQACQLTAKSADFIKTRLKSGVTETQLVRELERFYSRHGFRKTAFDLIVAMGSNTALPHHVPGETRLSKNEPVIFDIGCTVGGYRSDLTRTYFYGKITPIFRRVYGVVQTAQKAAMGQVRPGSTGGRVDAAARRIISQSGYGRCFVHSTGHGVGIDIHEPPWIRPKSPDVLKPDMILTAEPGIYLPGRFGVRIEDTLRVTERGYEVLTKS
ncbi:MAG: aminopeptidase P family protein [Elusimicrobia bacterium]|nr:aminopeptidase P family protein [Elusimicrobiota bacterium]